MKKRMTPQQIRAMHARKYSARTKSPSAFGQDKYGHGGNTLNVDPEWQAPIIPKNKNPSAENNTNQKKNQIEKKNDGQSESTNYTAEQKEQIRVMFEWGGCAITPQYCALIKGINLAYKIYRTDSGNLVKGIAQIVAPEIVPIGFENQVDACSNKIIEQINEYGLIDNISKQANLDKSVFQDMMNGTISNLLDIGINNQVHSTIDKMWSP